MIDLDLFFSICQGTLPWQCSIFVLVFLNEMDNRLADTCNNSGTNCCRSCKKTVKIGRVDFELKWGWKWKLCYDLAEIVRISFIWHTVVVKRIGIWQFWFQALNGHSFLYILWKVGETGNSDAGVLGERICTGGVDNCWTHVFFHLC